MDTWLNILIKPLTTINEAMKVIEKGKLSIALVIDDSFHLQGLVTSDDICSALLKNIDLSMPVNAIMSKAPITAPIGTTKVDIMRLFQQHAIQHLPIIDENGFLLGLETLSQVIKPDKKNNWVVLRAVGLSKQIPTLIDSCSKSLLRAEEKPAIQTVLEGFLAAGFHRFVFSINAFDDKICQYFSDGSAFDAEIVYIKEDEMLGAAGALSLLPFQPDDSFFVTNADNLVRVNYSHLLDYHYQQGGYGTVGVCEYHYKMPHDIVNVHDNCLMAFEEKPVQKHYVNAGIYLLEPDVLGLIPVKTELLMTELLAVLLMQQCKIATFSIQENWNEQGASGIQYSTVRDQSDLFRKAL